MPSIMSACIFLILFDMLLMLASCARSNIEKDYLKSLMKVRGEGSTYHNVSNRWLLFDSRVVSEERCPCIKPQCLGSGTCPIGYSSHPEEKFCYKLSRECKTWTEARQVCRRDGGDLISLRTTNFAFFQTLARQQSGTCPGGNLNVWVGASDISSKLQWHWLNGEKVNPIFWYPGEPNDHGGEEDCGCLDYDRFFEMNDVRCGIGYNFICQIC